MAFEATRFSENGLQLLAQLTTSKTLKIKHVYVDSLERDIEDLEQPPSWWATQTTSTMALVEPEIILAGAKETQARLRVKLSLKSGVTTTQTIKTIVICACAEESGQEGEEITFCGVMDSTGVEVLYHSGSSIKTSTGVSIYFKFSNASSISIETMENPDFVTESDLNRFVSCHKVSSAYEGDEQTIYGSKCFVNLVTDMSNGLGFGESASDVYFNINCEDWFMCFNSYTDVDSYDQTIYSFRNNDIDILKIDLNSDGTYNTTFLGNINSNSIYVNEIGSDNTFIRIAGDLIPKDGGNGFSIGSENNYFNNIYCYTYNGETFKSRIQTDSDIIETTVAEGLAFSQFVGTAKNWWSEIKYNNAVGPSAALICSVKDIECIVINENYTTFFNDIIAKRSIKFDSGITLYEDDSALTVEPGSNGMFIQGNFFVQGQINGRLPATDLDTTPRIPVGATVCLSGLSSTLGVGSIVQGTFSLCSLTGVIDPQGHTTRSDEEYQLLTSTGSNVTFALAMRIV